MYIVSFVVPPADLELAVAELYQYGTEGMQETEIAGQGVRLDVWFQEKTELGWLQKYSPTWSAAPAVNWADEWRRAWEPILVGERFFVVPDWRDDPTPAGRLRLVVHPAQASGSGYHPPTQLAIEALERCVTTGGALLDVGTGSGILGRAGRLLGASTVVCCDIDDTVLAEIRDLTVFAGSARAVRSARFDCVVANLNAEALMALRDDLCRVVRPGGRLVISGFKERRLAGLREVFSWPISSELAADDWRCLILARQ